MLEYQDFVIGELVEAGVVSSPDMERARARASESHVSVLEAVVELDLASARDVAIVRASVCECAYVDVEHYVIDFKNTSLAPASVARKHMAFPLFDTGEVVTLGMADPLDLNAVDQIRSIVKREVEPVLCEPEALERLIERAYSLTSSGPEAQGAAAVEQGSGRGAEGPIVDAVNQIIAQAVEQGASDVHLGPDEHELHLRYRIDGTLQRRQGPRLSSHPGLVQRLKVMANLDLTQTRRPQDGKFRFVHAGRAVDIRLSIMPTVCGENVVMRVLASATSLAGFEELGFSSETSEQLERALEHPHGMVLVTGPTGSGKTTTLYTALKKLNTPDRNVVTVEDPVEIRLPLVRQVQANREIGLTFASALRSILRQDPDVVLVGEIRDEETGTIALQAALTGHLVLSTLHTNDAPGAIPRLRDLGCPGFAINAALLSVLAQRLARRLCASCAVACEPAEGLAERFQLHDRDRTGLKGPAGCPACLGTGYRGRVGLVELMGVTAALRDAIDREEGTAAVRRTALTQGMVPMWRDGLRKAQLGMTSLEEVARIGAASVADDLAILEAASGDTDGPEELRLSA